MFLSICYSHRVNEIRSSSNIADWHFIDGKLNVANDRLCPTWGG